MVYGVLITNSMVGGWAYPSEKYELVKVSWDDDISQYDAKVIKFHGSKPPIR